MRRKKFAEFIEAKQVGEKGLAGKNGLIPNQDVPKADKSIPKSAGVDTKHGLASKDYDGPLATKPPQGEKTLPYKSGGKNDTGFVLTAKGDDPKGLGSKGNNILTPQNSMGSTGEAPKSKTKQVSQAKMPGKLTSEQFVEATKDMNPKEFADFLLEDSGEPLPTITDLYGNQFTPDPNQTIQYLSALMLKNPKLMGRLVRDLKRQEGGLDGLMGEVYDHPEAYESLVEGWRDPEEGKKRCHRVARAMNEQYMTELNKFMFENNLNEEIVNKYNEPANKGGPVSGPPLGKAGQGQPSDSTPMPNMGQGQMPGGPMGAPPGGMPPGKPSAGPFGSGDQGPGGLIGGSPAEFPGPVSNPPPGQGQGFDNGMPQQPPGPQGMPPGMRAKLKESLSHSNLISEIGGFPDMLLDMHDYCIGCRDKKK